MSAVVEWISVGNLKVELNRKAGLRHMKLTVKADGVVQVRCNLRRRVMEIEDFVLSCEDFIERRKSEVREMERRFPLPSLVSGEKFLWMGTPFQLDVIWSWDKKITVRRKESKFELVAPVASMPGERMESFKHFFKAEAKEWLKARVDFWTRVMGFGPKSLRVRGQRTLWGSCTSAGAVSLNWKLMCCPPDVIDYVVVHELCHLQEQNHSPRFWAWVERFVPDHRRHRGWLKQHQQQIARQFMTAGGCQPPAATAKQSVKNAEADRIKFTAPTQS